MLTNYKSQSAAEARVAYFIMAEAKPFDSAEYVELRCPRRREQAWNEPASRAKAALGAAFPDEFLIFVDVRWPLTPALTSDIRSPVCDALLFDRCSDGAGLVGDDDPRLCRHRCDDLLTA